MQEPERSQAFDELQPFILQYTRFYTNRLNNHLFDFDTVYSEMLWAVWRALCVYVPLPICTLKSYCWKTMHRRYCYLVEKACTYRAQKMKGTVTNIIDVVDNSFSEIAHKENLEVVNTILASLDELDRDLLEEYFLKEKSMRQISLKLGITFRRVSQRLKILLTKLRRGCYANKGRNRKKTK